jgi:S1-C subfamily serine protease
VAEETDTPATGTAAASEPEPTPPAVSEPESAEPPKPARKPRTRKSEPKLAKPKQAATQGDAAKPKPRRSRRTPVAVEQAAQAAELISLDPSVASEVTPDPAPPAPMPETTPGPETAPDPEAAPEPAAAWIVEPELPPLPVEPALPDEQPLAASGGTALTHDEAPPDAPPPPTIPARVGPSAAAAALEAARIVSEIVDIDTETGAVIAAAAAAGAAIEAARADGPAKDPTGEGPPVRISRESILRAIEDADAAPAAVAAVAAADVATPEGEVSEAAIAALEAAAPAGRAQTGAVYPRARTAPVYPRAQTAPTRAQTSPGRAQTAPTARAQTNPVRAQTNPAIAEVEVEEEEELDPVQLAAAVIQRLRARARDNVAELRVAYRRLDLVVIVAALVIIIGVGRVHDYLVTPPDVVFPSPADVDHGLTFRRPAVLLPAKPMPIPAPRLVHDIAPAPAVGGHPNEAYRVALTWLADARIEVFIDKKPAWSNLVTGLDLDRRTRWGELYSLDDSEVKSIEDHQWLRTEYHYAHSAGVGDVPTVDRAVEYATVDRDQIYTVTLFGTPGEVDRMEEVVAPSLHVASSSAMPLVAQTSRLEQRTFPSGVRAAFGATVMVVVADIVDGRLKPRGGGSGIVVGHDGSILTNYHVVHDKDGRLHDVFVIGRFSAPDQAPQLMCAGRPSRSKLQRDFDLALVKCDLDLDGRAWDATRAAPWATLPDASPRDIHVGQRVWVLGFPDVGGGGLTLYQGQVEGWDGDASVPGVDFIKTDAPITNGNSGGPVVDDAGRLIGVASAYRTKVTATGNFVKSAQVGLVRPIAAAADLVNIAITGWTPREGHTDIRIEPESIEAAPTGVQLSTRVVDASNLAPIRGALVMVLRQGVTANAVDVNALDDQVLAWGKSNANGDVTLPEPVPVPGSYTVLVNAKGYEPLVDDSELNLGSDTPAEYTPWQQIELHAR